MLEVIYIRPSPWPRACHRGARAPHGASSSMFLLPASKSRWRVAILVWAVQETLLSRIVESEECIAFRSGPDGCHISVDRKKSEKIACKTTHHVWVRHTTSGALSAVGAGALFLYCILILLMRTLLILPYVFFNQEGMA